MYAVIQVAGPIYGVGPTPEQAIINARERLDEPATHIPTHVDGMAFGDLAVIRCTDKLAAFVSEHGTPEHYGITDGVAYLDAADRVSP